MREIKSLLAVTLAALFAASSVAYSADGPPVAPVRPVIDTYFGTPVVDNYRYMENLKDPEVQSWMKAQADYTGKVLDEIPGRAALAQRIAGLMGKDLLRYEFSQRGDRLFYRTMEPGSNLPKLAYRDGVNGEEHILVDPAKLSTDTAHHSALDWYSPSWDGRYVAYGVSEGGSEESVLHLLDLKTGNQLSETINRTSDSVVSWRKDNQSFFYLRYPKVGPDTPPAKSAYDALTFLHRLGQHQDGDGDEAVFGRGVSAKVDVPEGEGTYVLVAPDSAYAIAVANRNMDKNPNTFYVVPLDQIHGAETPWQKIAGPEDGVTKMELHGDLLYYLSEKGASRFQVLAMPCGNPDIAQAAVVLPEGP